MNSLAKISQAARMLQEAKTLDDILEVNDIARAATEYARAAKLGRDAQNAAAEIALRAQRKAGEVLASLPRGVNQYESARPSLDGHYGTVPYTDEGVSRDAFVPPQSAYKQALQDSATTRQDANRWQRIAAIPEPQFEAFITETKEAGQELTTNKAVKVAKEATRKQKKENRESSTVQTGQSKKKTVTAGEWWQLGKHLLYCGDTTGQQFISKLKKSRLGFADPPYGAGVNGFKDDMFFWNNDYLIDFCETVLVTPGIVSVFDFAKITHMPYKWSLSAWVSNGMTRGAIGFGNWIYTAIFSNSSVYKNAQDFCKVSIKTSETNRTRHKGRKPSEYMHWIIDMFTDKGDLVIDPFAGSGTTLLMCELMGRRCITGEIVPEFCDNIIYSWESQFGMSAKKL